MLRDRLKGWLGGNGSSPPPGQAGRSPLAPPPGPPVNRRSNGLEQFFGAHRDSLNLSFLDLAGANQSNVSFITELGHRLYSEDFLALLDSVFGGSGDFFANQSDPERLESFCAQSLGFEEGQFDAVLLWDAFEWVAPPLLQMTVDRLFEIVRPGANLLAFFHSEERVRSVPVYSYRIMDQRTLTLVPRGQRTPAQYFNNRAVEKLFSRFASLKFFLARDHLREVLIRR